MSKPVMPLSKAVYVLADIHTRDDNVTGFVVLGGATPSMTGYKWTDSDYLRAWESLRAHSHMQIEPKKP